MKNTTRHRYPRATASVQSDSDAPSKRSGPSTAVAHSSFLPTAVEASFLLVYPATLIAGSLFSSISPSLTSAATYSHAHQSYQPPESAPSYFATKRNVLNVYFVKLGWFWFSLALGAFCLLAARGRRAIDIGLIHVLQNHNLLAPDAPGASEGALSPRLKDLDENWARIEREERVRRLSQSAFRWMLCTLAWLVWTRWFFGSSLIDRVFVLTGGACRDKTLYNSTQMSATSRIIEGASSQTECRSAGGDWVGGVDISGHVFLLVLGSGMIGLEILPIMLPFIRGLTSKRIIADEHGKNGHVGQSEKLIKIPQASSSRSLPRRAKPPVKSYGIALALCVTLLSWWMLLMTAAFFHTWSEKAAACAVAGVTLWAIYFFPRGNTFCRRLIGLPAL